MRELFRQLAILAVAVVLVMGAASVVVRLLLAYPLVGKIIFIGIGVLMVLGVIATVLYAAAWRDLHA